MKKPDAVKGYQCTIGEFYDYWFELLKPIHKLTKSQYKVASELLKERYRLSKVVTDQNLLDTLSTSLDTRHKVKEQLGLSNSHFQVIWGVLKKRGIIINDKINPQYIPEVKGDCFLMAYLFKIVDESADREHVQTDSTEA